MGCRIAYHKNDSIDDIEAKLIEKCIRECTVFVVFISAEAVKNEPVVNETMYASKIGKPICFVKLDDTPDKQYSKGLAEIADSLEPVDFNDDAGKLRIKRIASNTNCISEADEENDEEKTELPRTDVPEEEKCVSPKEEEVEPKEAVHSGAERIVAPDGKQYIMFGGERIGVSERRIELKERGLSDLSPLSDLPRLTVLILSGNNISDISPLGSLERLMTLNLSRNHISDISPLANLPRLSWLIISNNRISDVTPLFGLKTLDYLYLNGNPISEEDKERLQEALPKCSIVF